MNEQLKFSWGHIIAFVTLIFITYVSYLGLTYVTDGNSKYVIWGVSIIFISLLLIFIGGQILKSTDSKFKRRIWIERVLISISPILFVFLMLPFMHFWTVLNNSNEITAQFNEAIDISKHMFDEYEEYANSRVNNYDEMLERVVSNKKLRKKEYSECGFDNTDDELQREFKVQSLRLQLLSKNYEQLNSEATSWIDKVSGASVWNVFILGNIEEIKTSMNKWHDDLVGFSNYRLSNETYNDYNTVVEFDSGRENINEAISGLDSLNKLYTTRKFPTFRAIILVCVCYLFLLFPYFLQDRHSKSTYMFCGSEENSRKKNNKKSREDDNNEGGKYGGSFTM